MNPMKYVLKIRFAALCVLVLSLFAACTSTPTPTYELGNLFLLDGAETRSVSAENPSGEKGRGGMANPDSTRNSRFTNARSADSLGIGWKVQPFIAIEAGETATLMDVDGSGLIQHIWITGANRNHIIRFYWDNEETPSVEAPLPDFFAVGHEMYVPFNSAVVTVNHRNAMNCFWPMPFRKHARVTVTNEGAQATNLIAYQITYALTKVPRNAAYLHAQWRKANSRDQNPFVILDGVKGDGRYVGTFLAWTQMTDTNWWGEGEVKFFMDGDAEFPTYCGTGLEDYFLNSYGFSQPYAGLYSGAPLAEPETDSLPNYTSVYRWHVHDPIIFHKDLRVTIQSLGWYRDAPKYRKLNDDIASVAYWYQTEPHQPFPALPPLEQRRRIEARDLSHK
jgi:hypothetical protein